MRLTTNEIKEEIAAGRISAITLDTTIFDASKNGFEHGGLAQLKQFLGSDTRFVISDVIAGEVKSHVLRDARDAEARVRAELKAVGGAWQASRETRDAAMAVLLSGESPEEMFDRRYGAFVNATGLTTIESGALVDVKCLLRDYFTAKPPFGTNVTKKNEFPDAIALHALERWAVNVGTKMLVVAKDGDWKAYCGPSDVLVVVDDLGDALSLFHEDSTVICALISELTSNGALDLHGCVREALGSAAENIDFVPEASAAYYYETDVYEVEVEDFTVMPVRDQVNVLFKPVDRGEDYLVVEAQLRVKLAVTTSFSFSVTDSIDRDEVPIGSTSISQTIEMVAKAFITFEGDLAKHPLVGDIEVEFERTSYAVDYDEIEPDWGEKD